MRRFWRAFRRDAGAKRRTSRARWCSWHRRRRTTGAAPCCRWMAGGWGGRERPIGTALGRWNQGRRPFNAETQRRRDKRREKQKQARRGEQDSPLLQVARGGSAERGGKRSLTVAARLRQADAPGGA